MLSNNEVTEGLLIAVLGSNFVLLFLSTGMLRQPASILDKSRRLAIAVTEKMDCDKLIRGLLSCSGEQLRNDEGTAGDSLVSPDACSGGTAGQQRLLRNAESLVRKPFKKGCKITVKGSPRLPRGGGGGGGGGDKQGGMGYLLTQKH